MNDDGHDHAGHDHNHAGHSHDLSADALLQAVARRREQFPTRLRREASKLGLNDEVIGQVRERQTLRNEAAVIGAVRLAVERVGDGLERIDVNVYELPLWALRE